MSVLAAAVYHCNYCRLQLWRGWCQFHSTELFVHLDLPPKLYTHRTALAILNASQEAKRMWAVLQRQFIWRHAAMSNILSKVSQRAWKCANYTLLIMADGFHINCKPCWSSHKPGIDAYKELDKFKSTKITLGVQWEMCQIVYFCLIQG